MTREFQVLYRSRQVITKDEHGEVFSVDTLKIPTGPVETALVQAEAEDQVRAQFEQDGLHVVAVNFVRAVVDWAKPLFNRDEAAAYLAGISPGTLSIRKGGGAIPFSKVGAGVYERALLDQMIVEGRNKAACALAIGANRRAS